MGDTEAALRVGELARRLGVSPETLRAWERRYGVLRPSRTPGGYRVYGPADEARARRMIALIDDGWSAARAARTIARENAVSADDLDVPALAGLLEEALLDFDDERSHRLVDRLLTAHPRATVLEQAVLPVLRDIGDRWATGAISVAQEHFASELLAGRLRTLSRGWDQGAGPRAVLACPSAERHDLGLLCCGLALRDHGWRVTYLGADTPDRALEHAVARVRPDALVIGVLQADPLARAASGLAALAEQTAVLVGGAGASESLVRAAGAEWLGDGPVAAASEIAARGAA
jgi:DNA-binding transcriptional MerR regulator/methylmalonyl-CoA mutase cobalamin-binding subunit